MSVTYTNRKGITYYLCRGRTKTGKDRFYFAREAQGDPVEEVPLGFVISESVNGVVSLSRDRPPQIMPDEMADIEATLARHPQAAKYRVQVRRDQIYIYEEWGPDLDDLFADLGIPAERRASAIEHLRSRAHYTPVLRFILDDDAERLYRSERMCYRSSVDGWLPLVSRGSAAGLAEALIPTLGTDRFFVLW